MTIPKDNKWDYISDSEGNYYGEHWSRRFYRAAKHEGYKFAVRQHIPNSCDVEPILYKLENKEEMWNLPFIKRVAENEIAEGIYLPSDHPEAFKAWGIVEYADGEKLLKACQNNGKSYVIAYLMDL